MSARILGIDVAKDSFSVALECESRWATEEFRNCKTGFSSLTKWLKKQGAESVLACMEATGNYWVALAEYLHGQGQEVHVACPRAVHHFLESYQPRTKTDKEDARGIGAYLVNLRAQPDEKIRPWQPLTAAQRDLRGLSRRVEEIVARQAELANRQQDPQVPTSVHRSYVRELRSLGKERMRLEKEMDELIRRDPSLGRARELLLTIPGVGPGTARIWLAELGTAQQFDNAGELQAFLGLCPHTRESGSSVKSANPTTRVGHRRMKRALYMPALAALRTSPGFQALRSRHETQGKPRMKTVVAVMRKLAVIAYGMLKTNTPYDPTRAFNAA